MQSLQSALDLLLKMHEDRLAGRPDPHMMRMQDSMLALVKRDMLHISRPAAYIWTAFGAVLFVSNLMLFLLMALHLALVTQEPVPAPTPAPIEAAP
jgi:hypothetical protein